MYVLSVGQGWRYSFFDTAVAGMNFFFVSVRRHLVQIVDWSVGSSFWRSNFELNFTLLMCWRSGGESKRSGLTLSDDWWWGCDSTVESLGL